MNVFLETVFACFREMYSLTQTEYFAWVIAFALGPFLAIIKMLSFFQYYLFFRAVFCIEQLCIVAFQNALFFNIRCFFQTFFAWNNLNMFVEMFYACFTKIKSMTQTWYFALAIAFALWPFLAIFKMLYFSNISCFFEAFFAKNNFNVLVETLFRFIGNFIFGSKLSIWHGLCLCIKLAKTSEKSPYKDKKLVVLKRYLEEKKSDYNAKAIAQAKY